MTGSSLSMTQSVLEAPRLIKTREFLHGADSKEIGGVKVQRWWFAASLPSERVGLYQ
jgi:hypothetical protein